VIADGDSVLTVCTGNICRSPFGEHYLRDWLRERGIRADVASAGTHALPGNRSTPEAIAVAARFGLDLAPHRAQEVTPDLAAAADLIVCMSERHRRLLEELVGDLGEPPRIEVLGVPDPYGGNLDEYRECFEEIVEAMERLGVI
jgi:protein-tyrosine phosphatase